MGQTPALFTITGTVANLVWIEIGILGQRGICVSVPVIHVFLIRSKHEGERLVNSVARSHLAALKPTAMRWTYSSSLMSQGSAVAGRSTTPRRVRHFFPRGYYSLSTPFVVAYQLTLSHSLTEIRCPQPVPRDQFTIIRDLQPVYQFQDYFVVSCKTGYNLMEVRSLLHSLQPYSGFSSVCVSLSPFSKTFFGDFTHGNLLQFLFLPCFYLLSSSGFSFPSSLPYAVTVSQSPGRR